jgi:hypothetical protein
VRIYEFILICISVESKLVWRALMSVCSALVFTVAVTNEPRWYSTLRKSESWSLEVRSFSGGQGISLVDDCAASSSVYWSMTMAESSTRGLGGGDSEPNWSTPIVLACNTLCYKNAKHLYYHANQLII